MSTGRPRSRVLIAKPWGGWLALLVMIGVGVGGCTKRAAEAGPPPAVEVTVAKPVQREVVEWDTYTGYLEAVESVNVAARVSGLITAAPFVEGSLIKKGQVLFEIDDRSFKADLDAKLAEQEKAKAQLSIAQLNFGRQEQAITTQAVSQQDYDNAKATREQAVATLAGADAAVESARLNLEWCHVTSPIDGRVGRKLVTVGNLINGGTGTVTLLTTIQSVDPIYCYVDVDERSVLKYQSLAAAKKRMSARDGQVSCYIRLANETGYPHAGYIDFVDNHLDATTGTLRARGVFKNDTGELTPGFFASMRVPGSGQYKTLLVPDTAIGVDQSHRTVMVVNKDGVAEVRVVELGSLFGELRSITSGITPDDEVIINGQMRVRPGAKVSPKAGAFEVDPAQFAVPQTGSPTGTTP